MVIVYTFSVYIRFTFTNITIALPPPIQLYFYFPQLEWTDNPTFSLIWSFYTSSRAKIHFCGWKSKAIFPQGKS